MIAPLHGMIRSRWARRRRASCRPGLILIEMLFVVGLLAIFALVATQVLATSLRVSGQIERTQARVSQFDQAMALLRSDVWRAASVEADGRSATVHWPDGRSVVWSASADGTIVRVEGPAPAAGAVPAARPMGAATMPSAPVLPARWEAVAPGVRFDADGGALRVSVPREGEMFDRLTLVSQIDLAGRAQ